MKQEEDKKTCHQTGQDKPSLEVTLIRQEKTMGSVDFGTEGLAILEIMVVNICMKSPPTVTLVKDVTENQFVDISMRISSCNRKLIF